ncbi:hypothetical protein E3U55_06000 [Filobacillus milosensis]|uniref:Uncharacterized protein n=1 Tax=Filobacillus milosensis TaxID=94137 RepID=A0A4Y8IQ37_9BACI|nr:hypothetical protein [Filobacillus milosensis]TFB22786.1 hypothetical protein E3U55_06000 [Filobacillus milosensis]
MTALLTIIPIIVLAIVFTVVIITVAKSKPPAQKPKKMVQRRKSILKGYFIILLVSGVVYGMLQSNWGVIGDEEVNNELEQIDQEFYEAINNQNFNHESVKEVQNWQFKLEGDELMLTNLNQGEGLSFMVYVEKIDDLEGEVVATYYMKGIGEEKIYHPNKPVITWDGTESELMMKQHRKEVKLHVMSKEFPIRQFTGERWFGERQSHTFNVHNQIVYIQVPRGTVVETSDFLYIYEVN